MTNPQKKEEKSWLPRISPDLAVRVNSLLKQEEDVPPGAPHESEYLINYALQDVMDRNGTDIHFAPFSKGWRLRFRIDGCLHDVAQLSPEVGRRTVRYLKTLSGLDPVTVFLPQDASVQIEVLGTTLDLRLSFAPAHGGEVLAMRILNPNRILHRLSDLGIAQDDVGDLEKWLSQIRGMCLVAGPIGSGKTTTLYALLHELELQDHSIVTIENPVEYAIDGITQIQVDPAHGLNFAEGLKAMLRLDPDFMLVGEMRDAESARTAVEASASGQVVMSTLHSPDAMGVVTLLRNWNIADHQISTVLEIVICQRLVRRLCEKCRFQDPPTALERIWMESLALTPPAKTWHARGCKACYQTGYLGRVGVYEIWRKTEEDYNLLLSHADENTLRKSFRERGGRTLLHQGLTKAQDGITSLAEVRRMGATALVQSGGSSKKDRSPSETKSKS